MTKIKIRSNPYKQTINYFIFNNGNNSYEPIDKDDSSSSKLFSVDDFSKCFFPFNANSILSQLISDYGNNKKLDVVFEGPSDEFEELKQITSSFIKQKFEIKLSTGEEFLENGRDIVKKINSIFSEVEPIVRNSVEKNETIDKNLQKFSDVAKDIIPICVFGNTNMGKSTFINALLGAEYLPQDKERCTAKVYKITDSKQQDRALISFEYQCDPITIEFKDSIIINGNLVEEFKNNLNQCLIDVNSGSLSEKINCVLKYLNKYDENHYTKNISDTIDIQVPFNSELKNSNNPFVIFDTPGSNYSGNNDDSELLKHQMKDLTNGLPIFIVNYDGLSANDNDELIDELQNIKELDQRFTILIVNKSDEGKLIANKWNPDEEKRIKALPVPKKLSKKGLQGIYFVSSLMGLGFKNKGIFIDKKNEKNFKRYERDFDGEKDGGKTDPDYELYKFNILSPQLKSKFEGDIPKQINQIYLNSGLYSIEKEIEAYGNKYSAYNKCHQSIVFLNKVIIDTSSVIEDKKKEIEKCMSDIQENLSKKEKDLKNKINNEFTKKTTEFIEESANDKKNDLDKEKKNTEEHFSKKHLEEIKINKSNKHNIEQNIDGLQNDLKNLKKQSLSNLGKNISLIGTNFTKSIKEKSFSCFRENLLSVLKTTYNDLVQNISNINNSIHNIKKKKRTSKDGAYEEAKSCIEEEYQEAGNKVIDKRNTKSIAFWKNKSSELKESLLAIVKDAEDLSEEQRKLIEEIIKEYRVISFDGEFFDAQKNNYRSHFSGIKIQKLRQANNNSMNEKIREQFDRIAKEHKETFVEWSKDLLKAIHENIGILNPLLKCYYEKRKELTDREEELKRNKEKLEEYTCRIEQMVSWKKRRN